MRQVLPPLGAIVADDGDLTEVFLIPTEWKADCLVCSDNAGTLLDMLLSGATKLCLRHLGELTRRADAADGSYLSLVDEPDEPDPRTHISDWPSGRERA